MIGRLMSYNIILPQGVRGGLFSLCTISSCSAMKRNLKAQEKAKEKVEKQAAAAASASAKPVSVLCV